MNMSISAWGVDHGTDEISKAFSLGGLGRAKAPKQLQLPGMETNLGARASRGVAGAKSSLHAGAAGAKSSFNAGRAQGAQARQATVAGARRRVSTAGVRAREGAAYGKDVAGVAGGLARGFGSDAAAAGRRGAGAVRSGASTAGFNARVGASLGAHGAKQLGGTLKPFAPHAAVGVGAGAAGAGGAYAYNRRKNG